VLSRLPAYAAFRQEPHFKRILEGIGVILPARDRGRGAP
jgi:hypothetical protein